MYEKLEAETEALSNSTNSSRDDDICLSSFWLVPKNVPLLNGESVSSHWKGHVVATT